ncbi:chemotaxis protein CheX [Butyrivibrio sp. AE3006]|uniref:chemotaxis protein CheX n=1 Tax=Butyrivibrio sp. AE3006 TaxID=1280673 RepID=UPI0004161E6E|nr:chemotaxis protein CheX [Butyrivibrio sp. AE3006]
MFDRIMGRYLVSKGRLSKDQLSVVYQIQESKRAKLGVIAVTEKLMTVAQAEEINALQATMDKRFGDLAIERGYLSNIQVGRLLSLQGDEFLTFTSAIVERGYLSLEDVNQVIADYQHDKGLNDSQMESLKRGDLDAIVPIFLDELEPEYVSLFKYGIKNMYRLVDAHICIDKACTKHDLKEECVSYQRFKGDINATVALAGSASAIQKMAKSYTREEFIETQEDALDAMCELINCINGLYATDKSKSALKIELEPPTFITRFSELSGDDMHVIPIYSGEEVVYFIVSINSEVDIK